MDKRRAQLEAQLSAYLDDELTPDQRTKVEAFLAADADARALLAELKAMTEALHSLPRARSSVDIMGAVRARMERSALLGEPQPRPAGASRGPSFGGKWAAAAAIVLMTGVAGYVTWTLNSSEKPTVSAPAANQFATADRRGDELAARGAGSLRKARPESESFNDYVQAPASNRTPPAVALADRSRGETLDYSFSNKSPSQHLTLGEPGSPPRATSGGGSKDSEQLFGGQPPRAASIRGAAPESPALLTPLQQESDGRAERLTKGLDGQRVTTASDHDGALAMRPAEVGQATVQPHTQAAAAAPTPRFAGAGDAARNQTGADYYRAYDKAAPDDGCLESRSALKKELSGQAGGGAYGVDSLGIVADAPPVTVLTIACADVQSRQLLLGRLASDPALVKNFVVSSPRRALSKSKSADLALGDQAPRQKAEAVAPSTDQKRWDFGRTEREFAAGKEPAAAFKSPAHALTGQNSTTDLEVVVADEHARDELVRRLGQPASAKRDAPEGSRQIDPTGTPLTLNSLALTSGAISGAPAAQPSSSAEAARKPARQTVEGRQDHGANYWQPSGKAEAEAGDSIGGLGSKDRLVQSPTSSPAGLYTPEGGDESGDDAQAGVPLRPNAPVAVSQANAHFAFADVDGDGVADQAATTAPAGPFLLRLHIRLAPPATTQPVVTASSQPDLPVTSTQPSAGKP